MASTVEKMRKCLAADGGHLNNKPRDFSLRLVYEEFVISNKYEHYLLFVRPNLIYTLYIVSTFIKDNCDK